MNDGKTIVGILIMAAAFVFGTVALAAEARLHNLTGEVIKMDATRKTMTVKGSAGKREKEISVQIVPDTKITRNGQKTKLSDLKVGDRVVVRYASGKGMITAHSISVELKDAKSSAYQY